MLLFILLHPAEEVSVEQYMEWAQDRLTLFQEMESINIRGREASVGGSADERIARAVAKYMPLDTNQHQRKDLHSHFALRLAYSQTPENRAWLIAQERSLLRYRIERLPSDELGTFLRANKMDFGTLSAAEFSDVREDVEAVFYAKRGRRRGADDVTRFTVFRTLFEEALDLVAHRNVFLKNGFAYVHRDKLVSVILGKFRAHLSGALVRAQKAYPHVIAKAPYVVKDIEWLAQRQLSFIRC